jgi:D-specific alpha-keto acid dehydrogenase
MGCVTGSEPSGTAGCPTRSPASPAACDHRGGLGRGSPVLPRLGITVYGCGPDEATLFREMAPYLGITPTITDAPVSAENIALALGNRCISVGHKTPVSGPTLRALRQAGVLYVSTRSVGDNHIDVPCGEHVGLSIEGVAYSPDGVADYTVMLMLMAIRNTKAVIGRVQAHDYRLHDGRGKELRDLTIGVVGTGHIGSAVLDRLSGFGCRLLAHDRCPKASPDHVSLDELLQRSDVVTLHTPLDADTHHLLDRQRIQRMKPGAFLINTGRGALVDTEALLAALECGHLDGAALDVLEGEEGVFYSDHRSGPVQNQWLLQLQELPNVLITPHTAYYTDHALSDTVENTLLNCLRFERRAACTG